MNKQQQRIAIAEAVGWKSIQGSTHHSGAEGYNPSTGVLEHIPDYLTDLNAAQNAFQTLTTQQKRTCAAHVICMLKSGQFMFDATAAQWSEGVLRTLGKWEDGE